MKWKLGYIKTRVARRVAILFFVGSLVPVLFMGAAAFLAMNQQIRQQSEERLIQMARNSRQAIMQQLVLAESGVRLSAEGILRSEGDEEISVPSPLIGVMVARGERIDTLVGGGFSVPEVNARGLQFLADGGALLDVRPGAPAPLVMGIDLPAAGGPGGRVWASLEGDSIWAPAERFASIRTLRDFCVLAGREPLYCRTGGTATLDAFLDTEATRVSGTVALSSAEGPMVGGYAALFLAAGFSAPPLQVVISERMDDLYGSDLDLFRYSFAGALLLGLLTVALMASIQVRRTMTPLDALMEGTTRLAGGDLDTRVEVKSSDEFGELAGAFNGMAHRLGMQFGALEAGRAVDRAVLTALDVEGVVRALLERFQDLVPSRALVVLVTSPSSDEAPRLFSRHPDTGEPDLRRAELTAADRRWLQEAGNVLVLNEGDPRPGFLTEADGWLGGNPLVVFPLVAQGEVLGAITLESRSSKPPPSDAVEQARQVADQATVALEAVRMVGELEEMTMGSLRALAQAIDAKSRWTAGHSERVTALSLRLARELGLSEEDLETLERGGLLHDVGKIGVPARVLDSKTRLSDEDFMLIREHPAIGGRILAPIRAFAPALPIVTQHHERWDGGGYPKGLAGEEIHPLARIVSVADTFDAMASARPYRGAMDPGLVLAEIKRCSGTQFEPRTVDAFLRAMAQDGLTPNAIVEHDHA